MDSRPARADAGEGRGAQAGPPPDRREDLIYWLVLVVILSVFLTFNVLNVIEERRRDGHPVPAWEPAVWEGTSGVIVLAMAPLVMALARRVWPVRGPWPGKILALAAAGLVFSLVHVLAIGVMRWGIYRAVGGHYDLLSPLGDWPYEARKDLLGYVAIVASYVTWRQMRRPTPEASMDVLEVRDGARRHFVALSEVVWVEAAGNYVELHRGGGGLLHRASLADMERRLQTVGFVRIHRSRLVRREAVAAVESKPTGDFLVRLRDGRELAGSRRYRHPLLTD
ncbi:MAG: LytTR family transcriptional regulator DNA-binding domain-containing protein [Proteobacteria bacterium]|nr:LytTR family transcriptional regulator DNA-binding domain-containing protein [Pseudomonadota bacterium]